MSQAEDMDAIDRYITSTPLYTDDARDLRDDWIKWFDDLGWYAKNVDGDTYDTARNKRNAFNLANARTAQEQVFTQQTIKTGLSTEELAGGTDRRLSSGEYSEDLLPVGTKLTALNIGLIIGGGLLIKKFVWDDLFD